MRRVAHAPTLSPGSCELAPTEAWPRRYSVDVHHYRRPRELPFTADERGKVTVLIGGLTWKHERLIKAVLERVGHLCDILPTPDVAAFQIGKDYGNNAQCNPAYFCVGSLIQYLRRLEAQGLSRDEIIDRYVFFTAGACGPCRFGMYEAEYRLALRHAGFDGFRVLLFRQSDGVKASTGEPGLKLTLDLGLGALASFNAGDVLNDLAHHIRPFEVNVGDTDRALREAVDALARVFRTFPAFELHDFLPGWWASLIDPRGKGHVVASSLGKVAHRLYGRTVREAYDACRQRLARLEVDWLRVRPVVKVVGEFWAQTTEGDGNFRMFEFLEQEGAQVIVEPISGWVAYLLYQRRAAATARRHVDAPHPRPAWWAAHERVINTLHFRRRWAPFAFGEWFWNRQYARVADALGDTGARLVPQAELARLAHPFYHQLARGGEGHLEVGKSIYYTHHRRCHMVLSLKPFGCLPSTQSDGVHAAVVSRYPDMIFLPVETSGEGQINAYSRVQMALGEAKARARSEFAAALERTGRRLDEIRAFAADHPELRSALYRVPPSPHAAGTAARFVLHVGRLMDGRIRSIAWPARRRRALSDAGIAAGARES